MVNVYVIIPVYNCKQYLCQAIESVIPQANICLIDDGSTDGSGELCDELAAKDKRVHVIHQKNSGVSAARNAGIEYVIKEGDTEKDYVAFLDADDFWKTDTISRDMLDKMNREEGVDIYAFGSTVCNEDATRYMYPLVYDEQYCEGGNGAIWKPKGHFAANLYALHLFSDWNIRFRIGLKYSEDKIFLLQCYFFANRIRFMPQVLYFYRKNNTSVMSRMSEVDPIDYYLPIIRGWIDSDDFINKCESVTGKRTKAGRVLASIYFGDMAADHFKRWGKADRLLNVLHNHQHYDLFIHMEPKDVSPRQYREHNLYIYHSRVFQAKYYLIGAVEFCARQILSIKAASRLRDKHRFALSREYFEKV